jgi:hypothetical protein
MKIRIVFFLVIIFFPFAAYAEKSKSGDWWLDLDSSADLTEAFTANQSGSTLGFLCIISTGNCLYYVSPQTTCEAGHTGVILINSDVGALFSTTKCMKLGTTYYSVIQETNDVHSAITKSNNIGIAIPMKDGQFKVVRFSLRGANATIGAAAERAANSSKKSDQLL